MTNIDDRSALVAAMDQEAIVGEITTIEAKVQEMQARLTALRQALRSASVEPQQPNAAGSKPQQPNATGSKPQQPSGSSNLQQPSAAGSKPQQSSASSNPQQPSASSNLQQSSVSSNRQQPNASSNRQQPSTSSNLQQPSAASNLQHPTAASNLQPNNGVQQQRRDLLRLGPEKRKMIQQHLLLFLHAHNCQQLRAANQADGEQLPCTIPHCQAMKNVLNHMARCHAGRHCTVPHCASTRQIISHWKICALNECPVCLPLRQASIYAVAPDAQDVRRVYQALGIAGAPSTPQQHLLLYLHAHDCLRRESVANGTEACTFPHCKIMRDLLQHVPMCRALMDCTVPLCSTTRQVVGHWNNCTRGDCPMCAPVRNVDSNCRIVDKVDIPPNSSARRSPPSASTNDQQNPPAAPAADYVLIDLEQPIDASSLQTPSPNRPVVAAEADSQSPSGSRDAAGAAAPAGDHPSLSDIATINDMQKRLSGLSVPLPQNPNAVDGQPTSPHSPFTFQIDDIVPIPSRVDLDWHRSVSSELRKHLIKRLLQAIIPMPELPSILDKHTRAMMIYSQIVESGFFEAAESRSKYYHLLAEKIYKLQVEIAKKGQQHKDRMNKLGQLLRTDSATVPGPSTSSVHVSTQPNYTQENSMPRRSRQTGSARFNPLQIPQRRRQPPGVQATPMPDQLQTVSSLADSLLAPHRQQQLRQWYISQRRLLIERQRMEQTVPRSLGDFDANDISAMPT